MIPQQPTEETSMADEKTETHETPEGGIETSKATHSESKDGNSETTETTTTNTEANQI
jgi:hypothetical protein